MVGIGDSLSLAYLLTNFNSVYLSGDAKKETYYLFGELQSFAEYSGK